jgi:hypothetical protein
VDTGHDQRPDPGETGTSTAGEQQGDLQSSGGLNGQQAIDAAGDTSAESIQAEDGSAMGQQLAQDRSVGRQGIHCGTSTFYAETRGIRQSPNHHIRLTGRLTSISGE